MSAARHICGTVSAAGNAKNNFYDTYSFDVETELRREGHRPLRSPAA
ncbi:hypothetical protein [Mycobacterium sp.]